MVIVSKRFTVSFTFICFVFLLISTLLSEALALEGAHRNPLGMEFIRIPSGAFTMGSPPDETGREEDETQVRVTISKPFYLQTTEITLKQWWAVMGKRFFGRRKGAPDMPVAKVSWYDCTEFIEKLNEMHKGNYRLPTEAEWEYACRAGSTTAYSWGSTIDCTQAMYGNKRHRFEECLDYVRSRGLTANQPAPVKSYPPNAWGLYDMHGNVWEWCQDWLGVYPTGEVTDPTGPASGDNKIRRGGSWFGSGVVCRAANRNFGHPASRYQTTGFRLIWSDAEEPTIQAPRRFEGDVPPQGGGP
jgi:formylglycine-generating enzyme required for sulfatase activity